MAKSVKPTASKALAFTKMQGAGNDFIVLNALDTPFALSEEQIRKLADRHFGIGFDQLLLIEKPSDASFDFKYRIFNGSGEEVEHCGNGARCFAVYVHAKGLSTKAELRVETLGGPLTLTSLANDRVQVAMGKPRLECADVPFLNAGLKPRKVKNALVWSIEFEGEKMPSLELQVVSMGNPHAVILVQDSANAAVEALGRAVQTHPRFPRSANVSFLEIQDRHAARLRVYERGAGETLACGSGACAAVVAGILQGVLISPVKLTVPGGELEVAWRGHGHDVMLTGPAAIAFEGTITL
jgi:diaminopimelate epimerase